MRPQAVRKPASSIGVASPPRFWLAGPTGRHAPHRLMIATFPRIILSNAFFDQRAVVLVKREILRHSFIDYKASIPLLHIGN